MALSDDAPFELGPFATRDAPTGMVCSVDHLASSAGVAMLRAGGTAVDAAVATSAVLAVTTPHLCGMGGDLLALVHDGDGPPATLDASGRAGSGADPERLRADGFTTMPFRGDIRSVTVPGCVDGWLELHARFGRLPLAEVLGPAERLAEDGFPVAPLLSALLPLVADVSGTAELFDDGPLRTGALCRRPGTARALRAIAAEGRSGFYGGEFGAGLLALGDGEYASDDLESSQARWVEPIVVRAWGHDIWGPPPGSQAYLTLAGAWMADGLELPIDPADPLWPHLLIEVAKQAGFDRRSVLHERADGTGLLSASRLGPRREVIDPDRTSTLTGAAGNGDTIHLCAVDAARMGVSLIQSNAADFGSHLVEPSTSTFLHNRGIGFSLERGHPAEYGPRRHPPTTLAPALVTDPTGALTAVVGTMGGDAQPQVVLQLLARLLHTGQRPGRAIAAPRWRLNRHGPSGGFDTWDDLSLLGVDLEGDAPPRWRSGLEARGHRVRVGRSLDTAFGHAHAIVVGPSVLSGQADPRAGIGAATGW